MDHIKKLSTEHDKYQAEIADRLLWKVEKEPEFITKQEKKKEKNKITIKNLSIC
jgi:hypothetical protein